MITPSFHPSVGGVETHVLRVSQCLSQRGHQLAILTHADAACEDQIGALEVHRIPRSGWLSAWRSARPHIAGADIVHCHDAYSFLHFYLPSCWLPPRRPCFITFHGYERYPIPEEAARRRRFVRRRVRNAICMGDFICRWYGTPCFGVSYGGADPVPEPAPLASDPAALFLGRLAEDASVMLYLEALAILRRDYGRRLRLTVAGDGELRPVAERYAEAQGLRARFLGTVRDPDPLFAEAHFAFVSGYLAMWQALAHKRLVFAVYDNDLKRDYLQGFPEAQDSLIIADGPAQLASELNRYLGDPSLGDRMRERGARLAGDHSWERVADLYVAMYRAHGII